jgi:predicted SAM-dependent methyltransferase
MNYLNLGCGYHYHEEWTNLDFKGIPGEVQEHNLLKGIPFETGFFDVVYHSHVLEHFAPQDGEAFIAECFRVLKPGGILRVAVPDLEGIVREYLKQLEGAKAGNKTAAERYDWILLELLDKLVRHKGGGQMLTYLAQEALPNEAYVYDRIGHEAKNLRQLLLQKKSSTKATTHKETSIAPPPITTRIFRRLRNYFKTTPPASSPEDKAFLRVGKFRLDGEVHQWMYDSYSLSRLLANAGFSAVNEVTAFVSEIPNWETYGLDVMSGEVRKPDSLFMEATK